MAVADMPATPGSPTWCGRWTGPGSGAPSAGQAPDRQLAQVLPLFEHLGLVLVDHRPVDAADSFMFARVEDAEPRRAAAVARRGVQRRLGAHGGPRPVRRLWSSRPTCTRGKSSWSVPPASTCAKLGSAPARRTCAKSCRPTGTSSGTGWRCSSSGSTPARSLPSTAGSRPTPTPQRPGTSSGCWTGMRRCWTRSSAPTTSGSTVPATRRSRPS